MDDNGQSRATNFARGKQKLFTSKSLSFKARRGNTSERSTDTSTSCAMSKMWYWLLASGAGQQPTVASMRFFPEQLIRSGETLIAE